MSAHNKIIKLVVVAILLNVAAAVNTFRNSVTINDELMDRINELQQENSEIKDELSGLRLMVAQNERIKIAGGQHALSVDRSRPSLHGNP